MKKTNAKKSNASPTNNSKLPNINKNSKSPKEDSKSTKKGKPNEKKNNNTTNLKSITKDENKETTNKKMEELKDRKKKRMEKEKKEEQRDKKVYEQIVKEFQDNKTRINTETNVIKRLTNSKKESDLNSLNSMQLPQIKISEKKTQAILEESGMLDAYKYLIIQLCKNGFPTSNLFEYSAFVIKNYEKKWKEKKSKMTKEKVEKYWQEKKEQLKNMEKKNTNSIEDQNKMKALNRSFEEREINKLIKSLDKSRSSRHKQEFPVFNKNKSEENKTEDDKLKVSVPQKEGNKGKKDNKAKSKSPDNKTKTKQPDKKTKEKSPQPQKKTDAKKKK